MHRVDSRTYVGEPNERATVSTQTQGGGQVDVRVNGQSIGTGGQFVLPARMQATLIGPLGATCVVGVATVDGGTDPDFLKCQTHNPAPVNFYTFSVAPAGAARTFVPTKSAKRKAASKGARKTASKGARKTTSKGARKAASKGKRKTAGKGVRQARKGGKK